MTQNALYILDDSPWFEWTELEVTDSTNNFLKDYRPASPKTFTLVTAEYQQHGRGQVGNHWESERGKNLLFSLKVCPTGLEANRQFVLSQLMAVAIAETLDEYTDGISIKWPNDIYLGHRKIAGMLIENTIMGHQLESSILGVGLNVNQQTFCSDAPNPISLLQATGQTHERRFLLAGIIKRFINAYQQLTPTHGTDIAQRYRQRLYRKEGYHTYADATGTFQAVLADIEPTGHLVLADRNGLRRRYAFKEVCFVPDPQD